MAGGAGPVASLGSLLITTGEEAECLGLSQMVGKGGRIGEGRVDVEDCL